MGSEDLAEEARTTDVLDDFDSVSSTSDISGLPDGRYLDRELSWLAFNRRVLDLAEDASLPILERANFLAIFASNLDEFFMVRVAGLKRRILTQLAVPTNIGRTPKAVLADINAAAHVLQVQHAEVFQEQVRPVLEESGIRIVGVDDLPESERNRLADVFANQIFPVLMPLAVDPAHPFPYISGLSLNLAVRVRNPKTERVEFARLKVPAGSLPRLVATTAPSSPTTTFVLLEDLIAHHLDELFPGMEVLEHHVFRLTRNEDLEVDEDESENLLQALEKELLRRRFGPPIRLEITEDMDSTTLELLTSELDVTRDEVYRLPGPLDLAGLFELNRLDRPALRHPNRGPPTPPPLPPR